MKIWRTLFALWIIGSLTVILFNNPYIFKLIGISQMDVFNSFSLEITQTKISYFRSEKEEMLILPFMMPDGEGLSWLKDESMKYRTYFPMAAMVTYANKELGKRVSYPWEMGIEPWVQPAIYDYCIKQPENSIYHLLVSFKDFRTNEVSYRSHYIVDVKESLKDKCIMIQKRFQLLGWLISYEPLPLGKQTKYQWLDKIAPVLIQR